MTRDFQKNVKFQIILGKFGTNFMCSAVLSDSEDKHLAILTSLMCHHVGYDPNFGSLNW